MTHLKKILSYSFVLITMFSFLISTTGFTFHTHHCQHHDSQKSIVSNDEDCCSTQVVSNIKDNESCCKPSGCQTEQDHSTCCSEEISYHRLSEWFTPNNSQKTQVISEKNILFSSLVIVFNEDELLKITHEYYHDPGPLLKVPKYRLYSQSKLDPPLS